MADITDAELSVSQVTIEAGEDCVAKGSDTNRSRGSNNSGHSAHEVRVLPTWHLNISKYHALRMPEAKLSSFSKSARDFYMFVDAFLVFSARFHDFARTESKTTKSRT